jgi:hypothetical protein
MPGLLLMTALMLLATQPAFADKNEETYRKIAQQPKFLSMAFCMAGNSVKADVNPAVLAGWRGVHIPAPTAWARDDAELLESPYAHRVSTITELPKLVLKKGFWP